MFGKREEWMTKAGPILSQLPSILVAQLKPLQHSKLALHDRRHSHTTVFQESWRQAENDTLLISWPTYGLSICILIEPCQFTVVQSSPGHGADGYWISC